MRTVFLFAVAGLFVLSAPSSLSSQTTTGTVRGYVKDQNGTAIGDVEIEARNVATGTARLTTSRSDGSYVLPGLPPATYELSARHIGFTPQRRQVSVQIGATQLADLTLQAGAVELQAVSVEATPASELRTSEVATNVTPQQIQQLPTPSRNFIDLAALAPGVSVTEDRLNGVSRTFSAQSLGPNDINVYVDGVSLKNDLTGGGIAGQDASRGNPFPRNAVQEYRVVAQNFKAEYGKSASAIVSATTRSGTNEWHGGAFVGYQNKSFVALDTFQRAQTSFKKPEYTRYLTALNVGGPLIRDRLQLFASYEGNYQDRNNLVNMTPNAGLFPALDTVNLTQYSGNFVSPFRETLFFGKLNYALSPKSSAELSFNNRHETDVRDFGGNTSALAAVNFRNNVSVGLLKYNYFSGAFLDEAQVTYQRFRRNPSPNVPGLVNRVFEHAGGGAQIGSNLTTQDFIQKRIGLRNDVTYTGWRAGGDHVLKAGVTLDFLTYDVDKRNRDTPQFIYSDTLNRNSRIEAFDYQTPYRLIVQSGAPGLSANNNQIGAYVQDDWSPTPRLTLNLGVRWDFESHMLNYDYVTPRDVRDSIRTYFSSLIVPFDTTNYYTDGTQRKPFYGAFQPRLGFSYALDEENRTTIFGGWGVFYDRSLFDIAVDETLKLQRPEYTVDFAPRGTAPAGNEVAWNDAFLTTNRAVIDPLAVTGPAAAREVWLIGNDTKAPKSNQWNIGVRHLFGTVLASVGYAGSRSSDQLAFNWANVTLNANGGCCLGGGFGHGFSNILFTMQSTKTWYDAMNVQINRPYQRTRSIGWGAGLTYTYSKRRLAGVDNPDDLFAFPQATLIKKHPSNDERSRLVANWITDVPYLFGIQFSGLITLGSGRIFDVGSRFDLANFQPGAFEPPKAAFLIPAKLWRYRRVDMRLRKDFPRVSGGALGITLDVFNVLNANNYGDYNLDRTSANFGKPTTVVSDPRRLQLGAELNF